MAKRPRSKPAAKREVGLEHIAAALDTIERQLADIWMVLGAIASCEFAWQWRGEWPGDICGEDIAYPAGTSSRKTAGRQTTRAAAPRIPIPPPPAFICRVPPGRICMTSWPGSVCAEPPQGPVVPEHVVRRPARKTAKKT